MASERKRWRSGPIAVIVIIAIVAVSTYLFVSQMHISSAELVVNLDSSDSDTVQASLIVLKNRHDPAGIEKAVKLLESPVASTWVDAALYLGAMGRAEAQPYLVKAEQAADAEQKVEIDEDLAKLAAATRP